MKRNLTALVSLLAFASPLCLAQASQPADANDWKPSSLNQPGKQYPQVTSDGRVRTRISAPQAQKVELDIGAVRYPLTKGENGVWTGGESKPQDEGFHYYQIWIDGAAVPDPGSLYFYGASRWGSGVEMPRQGPGLLCPQGRPPRPDPPESLLLQDHQHHAALLRLHAAGL